MKCNGLNRLIILEKFAAASKDFSPAHFCFWIRKFLEFGIFSERLGNFFAIGVIAGIAYIH
jgi:hypothetical protein